MDDLFVDEVCAYLVLLAVVPGGEDLLAEEEAPWCVLLLASPSPLNLLTLGDGVHHMFSATAQSPHLQDTSIHDVISFHLIFIHTLPVKSFRTPHFFRFLLKIIQFSVSLY